MHEDIIDEAIDELDEVIEKVLKQGIPGNEFVPRWRLRESFWWGFFGGWGWGWASAGIAYTLWRYIG